jgi:hypothetical protein
MTENSEILQYLHQKIPEMQVSLATLYTEVQVVKKCADQNNRALRGTDSTPGLVSTVDQTRRSQEKMDLRIKKIESILHEGDDDGPGLMDQVRMNTEFKNNLNRWYVVFVGAIIVGVVNIAIQLITH